MPFGIQPVHLVVIAFVALLIFGPRRLPEVGRGIGRAINEFRKGTQDMTQSFRDELIKPINDGLTSAPASPPPPSPEGNFCAQCGAANPAEAKFCNKCGAAQVVAQPE